MQKLSWLSPPASLQKKRKLKGRAAIQRADFDLCSDSSFRSITRELPKYMFLEWYHTQHFLPPFTAVGNSCTRYVQGESVAQSVMLIIPQI